jgi:hypothetical protein
MLGGSVKEQKAMRFAVASLGKNRWYWVVWPSVESLRAREKTVQHVADGYETTKAEAVVRALDVAGMRGEQVAAKYARQYHGSISKSRNKNGDARPSAMPQSQEFLYRDMQDATTREWYSVAHRIVRKTTKYVYVEQHAYAPDRLTGSWSDRNAPAWRVDLVLLEREGYTWIPVRAEVDDPLFFSTPYQERMACTGNQAVSGCLGVLHLSLPCTIAEVKTAYHEMAKRAHPDRGGSHDDFLALQAAYEQALRLCRYWRSGG